MLYVFYGNNRKKVADQAQKLVASLLSKKPDAQVFSFEEGESYAGELDALVEAQGLFVERHIILIKQPLQDSENKEYVLSRLEQFAQSSNIVVIVEDALLATDRKKFERHAEKIEEHTEKKTNTEAFNIFQLGDLFGKKNKRELWTTYIQALKSGVEVESVHGTLHWAVRGMLLAQNTDSPEASGQKPFMHSKFKNYAKHFENGELNKRSRELVTLYHDARRGRHDLKIALEHWILSL
jgi:DNA polymerase III delta subunit